MMIPPLFCVISSILVSFEIMYPVALVWDVANFAPSVMSAVVLAMSVDYSLFLLTRYKEQIERGDNVNDAVYNMIMYLVSLF